MPNDAYTDWLHNRIRALRVRQQETRPQKHRETLIKHLEDCLKKYRELHERSNHGEQARGR